MDECKLDYISYEDILPNTPYISTSRGCTKCETINQISFPPNWGKNDPVRVIFGYPSSDEKERIDVFNQLKTKCNIVPSILEETKLSYTDVEGARIAAEIIIKRLGDERSDIVEYVNGLLCVANLYNLYKDVANIDISAFNEKVMKCLISHKLPCHMVHTSISLLTIPTQVATLLETWAFTTDQVFDDVYKFFVHAGTQCFDNLIESALNAISESLAKRKLDIKVKTELQTISRYDDYNYDYDYDNETEYLMNVSPRYIIDDDYIYYFY